MAQYILLIYGPTEGGPSPEEQEAEMGRWWEYTHALRDAGAMLAGEALQATDTATTVRVRDGQRLTSDGPFAETKEYLGGYYVIDVPDLDAALGWARRLAAALTIRLPGVPATGLAVEVRPFQDGH